MTDIELYMWSGPASYLESSYIHCLKNYRDTLLYQSYDFRTRHLSWYRGTDFLAADKADNIIALKNIPDMEDYAKTIGIVRLQFSNRIFSDTLDLARPSSHTIAFLSGKDGIIAHSTLLEEQEESILEEADRILPDGQESPETVSLLNHSYLVYSAPIKNTPWTLYLVIPYKDIVLSASSVSFVMVVSAVFMLILAVIAAYFLSAGYTKRLRQLSEKMRNIDDSSVFFNELSVPSRDEVGILTQNFNYMLYHISVLLDEKFKMGQEIKNAEMIALQEQINPHFLYNTLDQIYWMSVRYDSPDIGNLVLKLSDFYKLSLSRGKSNVPLSNEIRHVQTYVDIQNYRYDYPVTLKTDCDDAALSFEIPKLTLQPLVENAILHGTSQKESCGTVSISAHITDSALLLTIADDGVGMDASTLAELQNMLSSDSLESGSGYGLQNVRNRLRLKFQDRVSFRISSRPGEGTTITIRIVSNES